MWASALERIGLATEAFAYLEPDCDWPAIDAPPKFPPVFWKEVVQFEDAFRDPTGNWLRVTGFYREYGAVTAGGWELHCESLDIAYLSISWFRALTNLVRWLKEGHYAPVWEWAAAPRAPGRQELYGPASLSRARSGATFQVPVIPILGAFSPGTLETRPITDAAELVTAAWDAVVRQVDGALEQIALRPRATDFRSARQPMVLWEFEAKGAVEFAFLQWFFSEMAYVHLKKCAGCDNLVPPHRRKWCTDTCMWRVQKAEYRWKKELKRKNEQTRENRL